MFSDLSVAQNPKFKDGEHVMIDTIDNNPNSGKSKAIVVWSRFDNGIKENICFIVIYAYKTPISDEWKSYEKELKYLKKEQKIQPLK